MNTARKQHVTFSVRYISLSHDWLSRFGFLLTHRSYLGNCHGLFFCSFHVSMEISRRQFHSGKTGHTQKLASPWVTAIYPRVKWLVGPHCFIDTLPHLTCRPAGEHRKFLISSTDSSNLVESHITLKHLTHTHLATTEIILYFPENYHRHSGTPVSYISKILAAQLMNITTYP